SIFSWSLRHDAEGSARLARGRGTAARTAPSPEVARRASVGSVFARRWSWHCLRCRSGALPTVEGRSAARLHGKESPRLLRLVDAENCQQRTCRDDPRKALSKQSCLRNRERSGLASNRLENRRRTLPLSATLPTQHPLPRKR